MKRRTVADGGWYRVDNEIYLEGWGTVLGPYGLVVYNVLAWLADNESQQCWPTYQYIADMGGMSREQAILMVGRLVKYRLIHKKPGRWQQNRYTLLHHSEWQPPRGSKPARIRSGGGTRGGGRDTPRGGRDTPFSGGWGTPNKDLPFKKTKDKEKGYHFMTEEELERERVDDTQTEG